MTCEFLAHSVDAPHVHRHDHVSLRTLHWVVKPWTLQLREPRTRIPYLIMKQHILATQLLKHGHFLQWPTHGPVMEGHLTEGNFTEGHLKGDVSQRDSSGWTTYNWATHRNTPHGGIPNRPTSPHLFYWEKNVTWTTKTFTVSLIRLVRSQLSCR